jgi:hypothetical protein
VAISQTLKVPVQFALEVFTGADQLLMLVFEAVVRS